MGRERRQIAELEDKLKQHDIDLLDIITRLVTLEEVVATDKEVAKTIKTSKAKTVKKGKVKDDE